MIFINSGHNIDGRITPIKRPVAAGLPSFSDSPIVLRDQVLIETSGINPRTSVDFDNGDSALSQFGVNIDTMPLQFHTARPGGLPTPPEGAGHGWYARTQEDLGPDTWEFDPPTEGVWRILNTTLQWNIARPAPGNVNENTGVFEVASFLFAPLTLIRIYARARITVRYDRT